MTKVSDADVAVIERSACPTCGSCSGMFTANSMNCLTEALGLSLPGNGTVVATHADRRRLFVEAGHLIVDLARRWYEEDDESALPRGIANFKAFENAMTLDIAMGGSTNTVLHLLAAAHEGGDRLHHGRHRPAVAPGAVPVQGRPVGADVHVEDVHRAGGVMGILGELDRGGLLNRDVRMVHAESLEHALSRNDIKRASSNATREFFLAAPGGVPTQVAFSQSARYPSLDEDRAKGVIRDVEHAFSKDGGLAVLYGNIALDGSIVKTAGVDASSLKFTGPARIFESQDDAVQGILGGKVVAGDVVVIRYEGPRGGPGMQEMLYPTSYLKSRGPRQGVRPRHRRAFLGRHVGPVDRPCLAGSGRGRRDRPDRGRRPHRDRHPRPLDQRARRRCDAGATPGGDGGQGRERLEAGEAAQAAGVRRRCALTPPSRPAPRAGRCAKCRKPRFSCSRRSARDRSPRACFFRRRSGARSSSPSPGSG